MKNSKLAFGLGLGALIGGAVIYLTTTSSGRRFRRRAGASFNEIAHKAEGKFYEMKGKALDVADELECRIEKKMEKVKKEIAKPEVEV